MWILLAFSSAFFAGITSILAKCGIKKTDSNVATAIRTVVVFLFSWLMVFVVGSQTTILQVNGRTLLFLILSGFATGASWLCYFRALKLGDINKVVPIDKSSTVLTVILALIFLGEEINWIKIFSIIAIAIGTYLMIQKKQVDRESKPENPAWMFYAILSAVFASMTAILGKIGINGIESNLGTAIRTSVVLVMAWVVVSVSGKQDSIREVPRRELASICLSGFATGASWLCYYKALQMGPASLVVPIDKLSIVITIAFSYFVFKEKLSSRGFFGLSLIVSGTLMMLIKI